MWAPISTNSIIMNDEQRLLFLSSQHTDEIHFQFLICLVEIRVLQLSWIKLEQFDVLSIARDFQINIYCVSTVCLFQRDRARVPRTPYLYGIYLPSEMLFSYPNFMTDADIDVPPRKRVMHSAYVVFVFIPQAQILHFSNDINT